jgi:hypothetical protein
VAAYKMNFLSWRKLPNLQKILKFKNYRFNRFQLRITESHNHTVAPRARGFKSSIRLSFQLELKQSNGPAPLVGGNPPDNPGHPERASKSSGDLLSFMCSLFIFFYILF